MKDIVTESEGKPHTGSGELFSDLISGTDVTQVLGHTGCKQARAAVVVS